MRVRVVETASGQVVGRFRVNAEPTDYVIALSPDEKWFAYSGPGRTIRVRDVRAGVESRTIQGLSDDVQALTFNPDGTRLLSVDVSGNLKLWDFATGREVAATTLTGGSMSARSGSAGTGSAWLSRATIRPLLTGEVRILDAETAREVWSLKGHALTVDDADFSPGRAAPGHRQLRPDGPNLGPEYGAGDPEAGTKQPRCLSIRFVSDGRRLIGATSDRRIRVWDATPLPE